MRVQRRQGVGGGREKEKTKEGAVGGPLQVGRGALSAGPERNTNN